MVYGLPPATAGLPRGVTAADLPPGARQGTNDWRRTGWGGPCPPVGRHRYFFRLYALDFAPGDLGSPDKAALVRAMDGHVIAEAQLVGTYQKR